MNRMTILRRLMWLLTKAKQLALATSAGGILLIATPHLCAGPMQPASARNLALPLPTGGNGDSVAPWISANGRFVLFSSSANNLVPGDNSQLGLDVFLRDRASNTTVLVSANFSGTGGGNGNSLVGQVSTNGRYAVFQSDASDLLPGDTNGVADIFVRDLQTGTNILVNVAADGNWAKGASTDPVMTPDGRYVAFVSSATNLVAGDTNATQNLFLRDLVGGTTIWVTASATGTNSVVSSPVLTPDGRYVAFFSTAQGLVGGVPSSSGGEIYIYDSVSNKMTWVSTNAAASVSSLLQFANAPSTHPALSADGRFVAFKTGWTNVATSGFAAGATGFVIFQFDSSNGVATIITTNGFAAWVQNDDIYGPEMSPDGRFIVFVATNQSSGSLTVQLWDAQAGTNLNVSIATDGSMPPNSISDTPSVSSDGRYVVFKSNATNLTANLVTNGFHAYCRDMQAGTTQLIDVDTNGVGSVNIVNSIPAMSSDGRFVAFESLDGALVAGDNNVAIDVFVRGWTNNTTELISQRNPSLIPQTGNGVSSSGLFALSDDGRKLAFTSCADDLAPNDFNDTSDVFVYDVVSGTNALVSVGLDGNPAAGSSFSPALALGGRYVVFVSSATNLVAGSTNSLFNIYLRDLQAGTNSLVSVAPDGLTPGNGDSSNPAISEDGRYAVFDSYASNLAAGGSSSIFPNVYLRDLMAGTTTLLTNSASAGVIPTISADGRYVAYLGSASQLMVRDTQAGTNVYGSTAVSFSVISPSGGRLLMLNSSGTGLSVINLTNKATLFTFSSTSRIRFYSPWSSDGRYFTFVTAKKGVTIDNNATNDVYLCDVQTGALTLVSINATQTGSGSDPSDWPAISGDGHFVVYRSFATNIVTGNLNPPPNIFLYDCFAGSNSLLTITPPGPSVLSSWHSKPAINGNGSTLVFQSWNPNLTVNDLNRVQDVLAGTNAPWGSVDSDSDGIPDLWMIHYFGHATGLAGDLSRAQDDADGDGMSNLAEYLAGTDPTNPSSNLRLQILVQVSASKTVNLNWPAVPGKYYQIQFKTNLIDTVWQNIDGASVLGLQGTFTVPADQPGRFYRVTAD